MGASISGMATTSERLELQVREGDDAILFSRDRGLGENEPNELVELLKQLLLEGWHVDMHQNERPAGKMGLTLLAPWVGCECHPHK